MRPPAHLEYDGRGTERQDFDDITLGIDALAAKGLVDKARVGMCGWSYGGYAAAWATTHAKRFAATVMGAGICDWDSFSHTSILHPWAEIALGRGKFEEFSPLRRVAPDPISGRWQYQAEIVTHDDAAALKSFL